MLSLSVIIFTAIGLQVSTYLVAYILSPLRQFKGPPLAQVTNWWRVLHTFKTHEVQLRLHQQYGPAVRYGPNMVILNDPSLIKTIYNFRGNYLKSRFYDVIAVLKDGLLIESIFSTRDNAFHKKFLRPVQKIYSINNTLIFEPLVDKTTNLFCRRLEEEFMDGKNAGRTCDLGDWLSWYAWDVIAEITFSQPIGFLENACDVNNMIHSSKKVGEYFSVVGQMPQLDKFLAKNPYKQIGAPGMAWVGQYAASRLFERLSAEKRSGEDLTDQLIQLKDEFPDTVDDGVVIGYMLAPILAGSDTTSSTVRAIMYYLVKNAFALRTLCDELDNADLPDPITYHSTEQLPYFNAVLKEAMRLNPSIGMTLERVVPDGGLTLADGRYIPSGTIVGLNPWVVHRDQKIFGADAESFKPERWLKGLGETDEAYFTRLQAMKEADLSFGGGNRICTGKHLALMEIYKLIPTLLKKYSFKLVSPITDWKIQTKWVVCQDGFKVKIKRRQ